MSVRSPGRIAIVGGGISGLATAYYLRQYAQIPAEAITVIESADRLGGKVLTREISGLAVDTGPESLSARPIVRALFDDLGLTDAIVTASPRGTYVWSHGGLRRLPAGGFLGIPDRLLPLLRSRLLSPVGLLRAGFDVVRPRSQVPADATIAQLLQPRFGRQVVDRLVDPMLGGIHAGTPGTLSASSIVPDVDELARTNRSIFLALRRRRRAAGRIGTATGAGAAGSLVTLNGGLSRLVDSLAKSLGRVELLTGSLVTDLESKAGEFRLGLSGRSAGVIVRADAVVLATPAFITADLIEAIAPRAAELLAAVPYADVATVTLTYPVDAVTHPLDASGFLVPSSERRLLVGCTWMTAKWPHLRDCAVVVFRALVGRSADRRFATLDDAALTRRVHEELAEAVGVTSAPLQAVVERWPRALPQYTVGHERRIEQIDAALATTPGLFVTGAAYRGVGVAACVTQAAKTAKDVLELRGCSSGR